MPDYTANVYNDPCNHDTPTHQIVKEGERFVAYPVALRERARTPARMGSTMRLSGFRNPSGDYLVVGRSRAAMSDEPPGQQLRARPCLPPDC